MEYHTVQSIRRNKSVMHNFQLQVQGEDNDTVPEEEIDNQQPSTVPQDSDVGTDIKLVDWKELLGYPSEEVIKMTLENTTQLCVEPVESEQRDISRQHRKKRLLPLHPRRLPGRVDTDTFFSSVKSIRNYTCVQIFVHVLSDFLFLRCMQRESHSHGAYQDFIREVGAAQLADINW